MFPQRSHGTSRRGVGSADLHIPHLKEVAVFARVVRWEGADAEALKESADRIRSDVESSGGPPEGVPAKALLVLQDLDGGRAIGITFFETEEDYREGDETLNSMSPPGEGMGQRVGVDKYEVVVQADA
jgi:hypothetical protein